MSEDHVFVQELAQLAHACAPVCGAVLATEDGLVLAATGCLQLDVAAASATQLLQNVDQHLSLIAATDTAELLVWSASKVWYLARMPNRCVLMVCAEADCPVGGLRLIARESARRLAAHVANL